MECSCNNIVLNTGREIVGRDWQPDCPVHGVGTDWYEHGGKQYFAAYRNYSLEMQLMAREARRTGVGKSKSELPDVPQYKDLR